jgi:hypothetical protein
MINSNRKQKRVFKMHKASYIMIAAALIIVASIFLSPVFSSSTSQCSSCHGGYIQYLDILEGNPSNQLPTTLTVGQTATISVIVENNVNTAIFTALSNVALTLNSQNGHFTVNTPTYTISNLPKGTATATWQITAVSPGVDSYIIAGSAKNIHQSISFQDTYTPAPAITISNPVPSPTPTPTATPSPTLNITPTPTSSSDSTSATSPTPIQTTPPSSTSTSGTQPTPSPTPNPNNQSSNNLNQQSNQNPLKIWFTTPTEGSTFAAGNKTIEWVTTGGSGKSSVKLEVSKFGSSGPWTTLAENSIDNNFVWNAPTQDANYIIRAIVEDTTDPTQTTSVTVAAKVITVINYDILMLTLICTLPLLSIIIVIALRKRIFKTKIKITRKSSV